MVEIVCARCTYTTLVCAARPDRPVPVFADGAAARTMASVDDHQGCQRSAGTRGRIPNSF